MSQTTSLTSFMQQLQTLNDEYKKITKEIEHQDELIRAIQDQISSKQHQLEQLSLEDHEKSEEDLQVVESQSKTLIDQCHDYQSLLNNKRREMEQLYSQYQQLQHSYSMDIQKKREDYRKENIHFSNQIDSHLHKSQLKELNEEFERIRQRILSKKESIQKQETQLLLCKEEYDRQKLSLNEYQEEADFLNEEYKYKLNLYKQAQSQYQSLILTLEELQRKKELYPQQNKT